MSSNGVTKKPRTRWPNNNGHPNPGNGGGKGKGGRPPIYNPDIHPEKAYQLTSMFGCTYAQMGELFGITEQGMNQWVAKHPAFKKAIKDGIDIFHTKNIEGSLAKRACGYEYHEKTYEMVTDPTTGVKDLTLTKVVKKQLPPDPTSMIFWLKCRDPERWHDPIQQHKHSVEQINLNVHTTLADMISQVRDITSLKALRDTIIALPANKPTNGDATDEH